MPRIILTEDGTSTLFLDEYDQAMHSSSGAYQESLLKHIYPSCILEKKKNDLFVLDIGFGLGYNVLALLYEFIRLNNGSFLTIFSLEKEKLFSSYLDFIRFNDERDTLYDTVKKCYSEGSVEYKRIRLEIIFGDARNTLKNASLPDFDAVFQDPFSPAKNPELWSLEYFQLIYSRMMDNAILTTYSSADHIRMAMLKSGFYIGPGPSVGKKREGTIASKTDIIKQLDKDYILQIENNIKSEPYRDPDFTLQREEIIKNRIEAIRLKKMQLK